MKYAVKSILCSLSLLVSVVGQSHADAISSDAVMSAQISQFNKQQLIGMVERADVEAQLISMGVKPQDALARINAMTDHEINQLNAHLQEAPAGGIVGAVLTVLAVIAILDLAGVTDVYPFIRPISTK
ncbi:PA2779 family protein [Aliiglaciecola sp. CAU 1673]|uniref:DUF6627 family protein n=1 Tax=Aliiglaciecola sp. CAU 1673 TaxID=3032595 RepID=UPI0023DCDFC3|nr:DUF6627 family protein [Aliiglaciecola sp. CAU 1673]MDF2177430.1 PA2779 family protein [Aliiglaciecola sp. CAU 1673]